MDKVAPEIGFWNGNMLFSHDFGMGTNCLFGNYAVQ